MKNRLGQAALAAILGVCTALPSWADADLAAALAHARGGDAAAAREAMARIDDQAARDVVTWHMLRSRDAGFDAARDFVARNPDWPGMAYLRARVEATIPATADPAAVIDWFAADGPRTPRGALLHATALKAAGRAEEAEAAAIEAWLSMAMAASSHDGFLALFGEALAPYHAARLDRMAWQGDTASAERMLPLVPAAEAALGRARIALRDGRGGVDALIEAVPEALRDHPGLAYERFEWRMDKRRRADALELMFAHDASADDLGDPSAWGVRRERIARDLMSDGRVREAYRVAANHHMDPSDRNFAKTEWLAGYVALRHLDRPEDAADHFRRFDGAVASPISKGRAGYWLGRALEAAGDTAAATEAYAMGARYQTSFYGQLAAERIGLPADPLLAGDEAFPEVAETAIADSSVFEAAMALHEIGERNLAERWLTHLAEGLERAEIGTLIDVALDDLGEPHVALMIAKRAAQAGHELHEGYFPVTDLVESSVGVRPELSLAIARRESEFDPVVMSHAGARGLMQLMPGTAREMAGKVGVPYALGRLTSDPLYNARLGVAYLDELEEEFGYSPVLVPAAYNAGPSRARRWSANNGDPRARAVDVVDWIEDVPFNETRNYIMRVSESLIPYNARLGGDVERINLTDLLKQGYGELAGLPEGSQGG